MSTSKNNRFDFLWRANGKVQTALGLRTAILFAVPLLVGKLTTHSEIGLYIGLAGYVLLLGDVGGRYVIRGQVMVAMAAIGMLALFLGTIVANFTVIKPILAFIWLFTAGYLAVYGHAGVMIGIVSALFFVFAIFLNPGNLELAAIRSLIVLVGSAWAIFLSLAMWPIAPYQPLRETVASCYRAIAQYLQDFCQNYFLHEFDDLHSQKVISLRQSIYVARNTLSLNRRGRFGSSRLGELTCILIESADILITQVLTLIELVEVHQEFAQFITVNILIEDALQEIARICRYLSRLILNKSKSANCDLGDLQEIVAAIKQQQYLQEKMIETHPEDFPGLLALNKLDLQLEKIIQQLELSVEAVREIRDNHLFRSQAISELPTYKQFFQNLWLETLQANFTFESSWFRHALRLAIAGTVGLVITELFKLEQGFWLLLTVVLVLQPDFGKTFQRFLLRMAGTILGATVAPILLLVINSQAWLEAISILSISVALTLLRFHYGIAVFFISIFAIILASLNQGGENWEVALMRILCTAIGSLLAFLSAFVLFRHREDLQLFAHLARAIDCSRSYFLAVMRVYLGVNPVSESFLTQLRQENRLAYFNAQASLQRLIAEPSRQFIPIASIITLISYLHLFNRSTTTLLTQLDHFTGSQAPPKLDSLIEQIALVLVSLSNSLNTRKLPPDLPDLEANLHQIMQPLQISQPKELETVSNLVADYTLVNSELQAMVQRLEVMHRAVIRLQQPRR